VIQLIRQACNDGGKLEQVLESSFQPHSRLIDGLELRFETLTLCITAGAEDDTIALSLGSIACTIIAGWMDIDGQALVRVSTAQPWAME